MVVKKVLTVMNDCRTCKHSSCDRRDLPSIFRAARGSTEVQNTEKETRLGNQFSGFGNHGSRFRRPEMKPALVRYCHRSSVNSFALLNQHWSESPKCGAHLAYRAPPRFEGGSTPLQVDSMHLLRDGVESLHQSAHRLSESPARVLDILLNISIVECPYRVGVCNGFRLCYMRHVGKRSGRKECRKAAVSNPLLIDPNPDGIGIYRGGAKVSIFIET
jgi:hypothetical protein